MCILNDSETPNESACPSCCRGRQLTNFSSIRSALQLTLFQTNAIYSGDANWPVFFFVLKSNTDGALFLQALCMYSLRKKSYNFTRKSRKKCITTKKAQTNTIFEVVFLNLPRYNKNCRKIWKRQLKSNLHSLIFNFEILNYFHFCGTVRESKWTGCRSVPLPSQALYRNDKILYMISY